MGQRDRTAPAEWLRARDLAPKWSVGPVSAWWRDARDDRERRQEVMEAVSTWWHKTGPGLKTLRRDAEREMRSGWKTHFYREVVKYVDSRTGGWHGKQFTHDGQVFEWNVIDARWDVKLWSLGSGTLPEMKTVPHGVAARCYPPISCDCPRCWLANGEYRRLARFAGRPRKGQG